MGVAVSELIRPEEISLSDLTECTLAVDASLMLYQFLASIRQRDGTPLRNAKGQVTSHLTGLFTRTAHLMQEGIRLVFVFDGKPPALKEQEQQRRRALKEEAQTKYEEAQQAEDVDAMRKYSARLTRLTPEMVGEAQQLLSAMGIPYVTAPSEAEAQAAHMVSKGDCYAVATQDADVFMFGALRVVRNLSILGKRKKANTLSYTSVKPERISLSGLLNDLGIDREQFIALCMLVGTDYNSGGIKGIGPKKALKLVKKYGDDRESLFSEVGWSDTFPFSWEEVFSAITQMPVTDEYSVSQGRLDPDAVEKLLVEGFSFSEERVQNTLRKLEDTMGKRSQTSLFDY